MEEFGEGQPAPSQPPIGAPEGVAFNAFCAVWSFKHQKLQIFCPELKFRQSILIFLHSLLE